MILDPKDLLRFRSQLGTGEGCHLWRGTVNGSGRAQIKIKGKLFNATRLAYEYYHGKIPEGKCVCHSCDVPTCTNPDHLWLGTVQDNVADRVRKNRSKGGAPLKGLNHATLTVQLAKEVKILSLTGAMTQQEIANVYQISRAQVSKIKRGVAWSNHLGA